MTDSKVASKNYVHCLTQWKIVGNSTVHTDEYLTQWKVSGNSQIQQYLTQWKVEGNSVVDNNAILSCGDLGQDGKYHVKISNGVDVFDIALTEPLRKVGDVADNIELINGVVTLTRKTSSIDLGSCTYYPNANGFYSDYVQNFALRPASGYSMDVLCAAYPNAERPWTAGCMGISLSGSIWICDTSYESETAIKNALAGVEMIYKLKTPIAEIIQAPQISVSPTNTYSSANTTPYSAFTYANPLIYSCGDYSDVDGKYHVKISNGVTIYDIPLTEPLRKVNNVADSIEYADGVAVVTRNIANAKWRDLSIVRDVISSTNYVRFYTENLKNSIYLPSSSAERIGICLSSDFSQNNAPIIANTSANPTDQCMTVYSNGSIYIRDTSINDATEFQEKYGTYEFLYRLATPTTETIQVSPFPVSPTDTYTSANDTPYSAFEFKKNVEIWSCGEYSAVDGKYHILVQPQGGSIADIALIEPLRKWDNDYIDNIDYNNGVATLTRKVGKITVVPDNITLGSYGAYDVAPIPSDILYETASSIRTKNNLYEDICNNDRGTSTNPPPRMYIGSAIHVRGTTIQQQRGSVDDYIQALKDFYNNGGTLDILYKLATPTTEIIQVPQIQEADSYSCVISQGGKAVSWSSFETD